MEISDPSAFSARLNRTFTVKNKRNDLAFLLIVTLIVLLATFLRFHLLDAQSFWNDEGNTARLSERSLRLIIAGTASDIHPPLYYILLRGWRELVGSTEFGLRSFSVFAGILMVAGGIALGRLLAGKRAYLVALIVGLATAVNPALVYYSQEARMYALLGFLAVLVTLLLIKWLRSCFHFSLFTFQSGVWAGAYVLLATAGLYTHYFFPTILVAHNLFVLFVLIKLIFNNQQRTSNNQQSTGNNSALSTQHSTLSPPPPRSPSPLLLFLTWSTMMLLTLLLYSPWLPIFLGQFGSDVLGSREAVWIYLRDMLWWMGFGGTLPFVGWAFVGLLFLLVLGIIRGGKRAILPLLCMLVPMAFMVIGATGEVFFKFLIVSVPFMILLIGLGVDQPRRARRGGRNKWLGLSVTAVSIILLLLLILPTMQSLNNLYSDPAYARADYRGIAQRILDEDRTNTAVILNAPNQWEVFTYYYRDDTAVFPIPEGLRYASATEKEAWVQAIAEKYDRIYLILWGETEWDPERRIERWLDENGFKATGEWVKDVRFVTYAIPSSPATEMETELDFPVGDEGIVLKGFTLLDTELRPTDVIQVTLFWETAVPLTTRSKVFLHLLDSNGQLVAQRDSEPGGGLALTSTWPPNETIIDNHGILIPPDLPAGEYTLTVGMYDIADPSTRLPIQTKNGEADVFPLATIIIE